MNFPITEKYRTIHSINDKDVQDIIKYFESLDTPNIFLDYGCHLGHLAIEIALRFPVTVYAVDNFVGTTNDSKMKATLEKLTETGNFYDLFLSNITEVNTKHTLKGTIVPLFSNDFFGSPYCNLVFDFAFIDSSHRIEEAEEFFKIDKLIRPGGILSGHDLSLQQYGEGVRRGISLIEHNYTWLRKSYTWFMKKK
jgi:cyclopropane fatty-acyl-phospholipid synthase-like methyltransferase